ncbi:MAG: hypothetical protein LBQ88_14625 [Treponema sp.]|nr:hypothetical protein [Treponema sp.]
MKLSYRSVDLDESAIQALKKMPVDIFTGNYLGETKEGALILVIDVRNFSTFLRENDENTVFALIKEFTSNFLSCVNQLGYNCSYYKLEGDGAIVIWDQADESCLNAAVDVFSEFAVFSEEALFKDCPSLGVAGALVLERVFKYEISAEASGLMYRDYVGYGINLACRLQNLAGKNELAINHRLIQEKQVPFTEKTADDVNHRLSILKGLRDIDKDKVYMYKWK